MGGVVVDIGSNECSVAGSSARQRPISVCQMEYRRKKTVQRGTHDMSSDVKSLKPVFNACAAKPSQSKRKLALNSSNKVKFEGKK